MAVAVPQMASNRLIKRPQVSNHFFLFVQLLLSGMFCPYSLSYVEYG